MADPISIKELVALTGLQASSVYILNIAYSKLPFAYVMEYLCKDVLSTHSRISLVLC